ncbi:cyclophilin-like fold protein [Streptomyces griseorubiginosus]|uniref:cyclophilin-like fold protein n=1 Tax=Streptomyces griseorubiginosus TaxID=67304 RepID=UPI0034105757
MNILLTINGTPVDATLNDSAAAKDFAAQLPLTLNLTDFHEAEKIADLPRKLSTSGAPQGAAPHAGDLAYYAPWGNLALFYRGGSHATGLVIIGHMADSGINQLSGASPVDVTITEAS